jgi:hypothetical protein
MSIASTVTSLERANAAYRAPVQRDGSLVYYGALGDQPQQLP